LSKGITIVITALDTKGVTSYLGNFKQKIAFEALYKLFFSFDSGFGGQFFHHAGGIDAACGVFPWAWDTFYCSAMIFESIREAFNFIKSNMRIINIISGILLILLGAAMLFNII